MFNMVPKENVNLESKINEIKEALIGVDIDEYSFKRPASYSAFGKIELLEEQVEDLYKIIGLLLDKLNYSLKHGMVIIDKEDEK